MKSVNSTDPTLKPANQPLTSSSKSGKYEWLKKNDLIPGFKNFEESGRAASVILKGFAGGIFRRENNTFKNVWTAKTITSMTNDASTWYKPMKITKVFFDYCVANILETSEKWPITINQQASKPEAIVQDSNSLLNLEDNVPPEFPIDSQIGAEFLRGSEILVKGFVKGGALTIAFACVLASSLCVLVPSFVVSAALGIANAGLNVEFGNFVKGVSVAVLSAIHLGVDVGLFGKDLLEAVMAQDLKGILFAMGGLLKNLGKDTTFIIGALSHAIPMWLPTALDILAPGVGSSLNFIKYIGENLPGLTDFVAFGITFALLFLEAQKDARVRENIKGTGDGIELKLLEEQMKELRETLDQDGIPNDQSSEETRDTLSKIEGLKKKYGLMSNEVKEQYDHLLEEINPKHSLKAPFMLAGATYIAAELFSSVIEKVPLPCSKLIATGIKWGAPGVVFVMTFRKTKLYGKICNVVAKRFNYLKPRSESFLSAPV